MTVKQKLVYVDRLLKELHGIKGISVSIDHTYEEQKLAYRKDERDTVHPNDQTGVLPFTA